MTAAPTTAYPGQELTYTITYTNFGAAEAKSITITYANSSQAEAKNVVITDTIPAGATYVAGSADASGGVLSGNTLTWTIPSVAAGAQGAVSFKVKIE